MFRVAAGLLKDFAARSPRLENDIGFTAVLPKGCHRLRDYGFLRGNAQLRQRRIQLLLQVVVMPPNDTLSSQARPLCPFCHRPMQWAGVQAARPPTTG